jgi:AraC family transcriptional regulator of adaptative response/methylated-DNA-[protein]-cysteine methyltransferase
MTAAPPSPDPDPLAVSLADYDCVRRAVEFIGANQRAQPTLEDIAAHVGLAPARLSVLFRRWAGVTPKDLLQAFTLDHARRLLRARASVLDAAHETGLSGPGRLHDLFVAHEAMSPGEYKSGGAGLELVYGFHPSPFGHALAVVAPRGLAGLGFAPDGEDPARAREMALADMARRWPAARLREDPALTAPFVRRIFDPAEWRADRPLRIVLIGADFEMRVWERLLRIPLGAAATYGELARDLGRPTAARAVGAAVGRNPISFVVPCHRVVGASGALTGYHWGLARKRAMLGWEAGRLAGADGEDQP